MTLPEGYRLRDAGPDDLTAIAALRESVGWAAHDWALRIVIAPPARCFVLTTPDGSIAAVGSGIAYGALGFVGNMIVADGHRRRGLGSAILTAVTAHLAAAGASRLELYATATGRPLYLRHGFVPAGSSAMVRVPRGRPLEAPPGVAVERAGPPAAAELAAYDAPRFGGDRRTILDSMLADPGRPVLVARRAGTVSGYLWLRADAERVGPFLAEEPAVAAALLSGAFTLAPDAGALGLNLPMANEAGTAWLRSLGVELEPWDGRMARGPAVERREETIYGNLVGALG